MKARLPQGYGGGPGNLNSMMKQAQKMQQDMAALQEDLDQREYTAKSGGGMVEVTVTGKHAVTSIKSRPEVVDPDDVEMLEDLVAAAVNEAVREATETAAIEMEKITGGVNLPGIL